jgi:hypothetical protein
MAGKPKNPFQFWEKLKQRRVVRVITVYVASSFAILQGLDMIFSRLGFPSWTVTLVMIILACGLIVSIILSWIYDITPEGVKRTKDIEPMKESREQKILNQKLLKTSKGMKLQLLLGNKCLFQMQLNY